MDFGFILPAIVSVVLFVCAITHKRKVFAVMVRKDGFTYVSCVFKSEETAKSYLDDMVGNWPEWTFWYEPWMIR